MPCKLVRIDDTSDFQAPSTARVTLATKNHVGQVLISKAEYNGDQLVPAGKAVNKINLTVAKDRHTLKMVFVFDAMMNGRGELREVDGSDSQFLIDLKPPETFQMIRIVGK